MDSFNPTTKTQAALTAALQAASAAGNPQIAPAHLLMALLTQNDGIAAPLLEAVGVDPATIRSETQRLLDRLARHAELIGDARAARLPTPSLAPPAFWSPSRAWPSWSGSASRSCWCWRWRPCWWRCEW